MDQQIILLFVSLTLIAMIFIVFILNIIQNRKSKNYRKQLEQLEIQKNLLDSSPVIPELSKVESITRNEKLESMYDNWSHRLDVIRTEQIPKITDMLLEADYSLSKQDYKNTIYKIAKLEMEIYKVRTNSQFLLSEIKEITNSEERNRTLIIDLKAKYRELYEKYNNSKSEFSEIGKTVELQFENIARKFEEFEQVMDQNEYTEVPQIVKSIDEMLKHMENVVEDIPSILLIATSILPKKISEVESEYNRMLKKGYPIDYLNVEYNIKEAEEKIRDILKRSSELNMEDSVLELKVLVDYFEGLLTDFDKEKVNKHRYEDANKIFKQKFDKINGLIVEIFNQLDEIRNAYNLSDNDVTELSSIRDDLEKLSSDYKVLVDHTSNNTFAYSQLNKEIEQLTLRVVSLEERVDIILDMVGSMKEDEVRARQQLEEVKQILKEAKIKIKEFDLPIIPQAYFVELNDAQLAIKEIIKELEKKPITIDILNTRVDTARDLVLKLYNTTKEMMRTAMFAEMAIVYGNRYRSEVNDLDKYLTYAERLFFKGEYQKSLEISINSLNKVESGIYNKLLKLYSKDAK